MIRTTNCRERLIVAGLVGALLWSAPSQAQDSVVSATSKGIAKKGTITKTSPTDVTLESAGATQDFPVNELRKVSFSGEPGELERARESVRQGNYNNASEELKKLKEPPARDLVKQDVEFYTALCAAKLAMEGNGDKKAAGALMKAFIDNHPGSFHYFEACESFGDLAVSVGGYEAGAKYYALLGQAPWPDYKMRAAVYEARALVATEKYPEALQKYEQVIASTVTTPEAQVQKQFATVGKAVCLANTGKVEEGIALLEEIIKNGDPAAEKVLFARVYNALGACQLKAGRNKDALMAYLHVHLLFPNAEGESHAEALFNLVKLWAEQNKQKDSTGMRKMLTERYPGSPWAVKK